MHERSCIPPVDSNATTQVSGAGSSLSSIELHLYRAQVAIKSRMADDGVEQFVSVTGASKENAKFYLDSAGGNVEAAIDSFFGTGGGAADGPDEKGASMDEGPADALLSAVPSTGAT